MPLLSPIRATCPALLILLDFITRKMFGEEYNNNNNIFKVLFEGKEISYKLF